MLYQINAVIDTPEGQVATVAYYEGATPEQAKDEFKSDHKKATVTSVKRIQEFDTLETEWSY